MKGIHSKGIVVSKISKTIKHKKVLNDISLHLTTGHIYGFYGPNASGKTMLFRAIAGLIKVDKGTIDVFGERIGRDIAFPRNMGLMIENASLWGNLTGYENLELLASIKKVISTSDIQNAMERVGLDPSDRRRYSAYSLGMKQKLALAQAIMESPSLLILDEPTNSLDEASKINFRHLIAKERNRGVICLISTHQEKDIEDLCDGIFQLDSGFCERRR